MTGDARRGHTNAGSQLVKTAALRLVLDRSSRVPKESREIYFPPGKFVSRELTTLLDSNGKILGSPMDMVQEFNSYFASVFTSENISILPYVADMFCGAVEDKCQDV